MLALRNLLFALAASASAEPVATPSLAHALLGAALFPANATILANHRQLKGKAKTVPAAEGGDGGGGEGRRAHVHRATVVRDGLVCDY